MALEYYDNFYGGTTLPMSATEAIMRGQAMEQQRMQSTMQPWNPPRYSPVYYPNFYQQDYSRYAPPTMAHYCDPVPRHLEAYYDQLLTYHKQAGYKPEECEMLCCSLKILGINY